VRGGELQPARHLSAAPVACTWFCVSGCTMGPSHATLCILCSCSCARWRPAHLSAIPVQLQMPMDDKLRRADEVIDNNGSEEDLEKQVRGLLHALKWLADVEVLPHLLCPRSCSRMQCQLPAWAAM
jgi:hypothetical protein